VFGLESNGRKGMKKDYEAPMVITYSEDEIVDMLGPAQTCSPTPSPCPSFFSCPTYD
jgi:hypothetical protein